MKTANKVIDYIKANPGKVSNKKLREIGGEDCMTTTDPRTPGVFNTFFLDGSAIEIDTNNSTVSVL